MSDYLNGLTDENIRIAITGKIDVDTDTLAKAMEVIKTDIRESKRKLTKAQEIRDRGYTPKYETSSSIRFPQGMMTDTRNVIPTFYRRVEHYPRLQLSRPG